MTYLIGTYIREDMIAATRSMVLFQGDWKDAQEAYEYEKQDSINEGYKLIEEYKHGTIAVLRGYPLPDSRSMYTTILELWNTDGDGMPFWNLEWNINI